MSKEILGHMYVRARRVITKVSRRLDLVVDDGPQPDDGVTDIGVWRASTFKAALE